VARDSKKSAAEKKSGSEGWVETFKTVFWAVVIAVVVRTFAYEPFSIPSGSMLPGLLVGDYLFVSKFSYGYSRYSFPWSPPIIGDRVLSSDPKRGDVAVFRLPNDPTKDYIKRIIGLPGDRIQVREGRLHINGKVVERRAVRKEEVHRLDPRSGEEGERQMYIETLPNGRSYRIFERGDSEEGSDNTPEYSVPAGHFFFMGDNRDNSCDSRFMRSFNPGRKCLETVGYVPARNLIGRADFLFFSTDGSAEIWEIWHWPAAIRFSRLLSGVK
jgi:signal peptidase I